MKISQIITGSRPAPTLALAAKDLQQYLRKLFNQTVPIVAKARPGPGVALCLDNPEVSDELGLSDQGYALRLSKDGRRSVFQVAGGSPAAAAWGAYELAESWGVRFLLHRDMLPDRAGPLKLPAKPIVREPDMRLRGFRTYNDLWTPCHWPASEFETLFQQLMKMRFNAIIFMQYPDDACFDLKWRGAAQDVTAPNYGFEIPLAPDAIGHELFEESGDAARGQFGNPDVSFEKDYQSTVRAGRRFFKRVCDAARQRGIAVSATVMTDFPWPIKERLAQVTPKAFLRSRAAEVAASDPKGHFLEPPTMIIRYGKSIAGATKPMAAAMSIRNPAFLDLMRTAVQSYVDAFEGSDFLMLTTAEFRPTAADMDYAWQQLDRKFGLAKIASLKTILRESREGAEVEPKRAEYELRADVCMLWLYDYLIHEHPPRRTRRSPRLVPGRLSVELNRFLPAMFPDVDHYTTWAGYLPQQTIKRQDTLAPFKDSPLSGVLWINVEDDNVGIVPQHTGRYMQQTMPMIRRHKLGGFYTRQFLQSKLVGAISFLAHSAWDRRLTADRSYEHLFEGACGKAAMRPLLKAIAVLSKNTKEMYDHFDCVSFLMPRIVSSMASVFDVGKSWPGGVSDQVVKRHRRIGQLYGQAADLLADAVRLSRPAGREVLEKLQHHARFGHHYMLAMGAKHRACNARARFLAAKEKRAIDAAVTVQDAAAADLAEALDQYRLATRAWADSVEDRVDLSVLACLNHYVCGAMESIQHLASLENHWSVLP